MSDWKSAFGIQAQSDYRIYEFSLAQRNIERCHSLHYLQMATEKLSKYFLTPKGSKPKKITHSRFARFVQTAKTSSGLQRACRFGIDVKAYAAHLDALAHIALKIESLAPKGSMTNVNPEYPWEQKIPPSKTSGRQHTELMIPCRYPFEEFDPKKNVAILNLLSFVKTCFVYLDAEI